MSKAIQINLDEATYKKAKSLHFKWQYIFEAGMKVCAKERYQEALNEVNRLKEVLNAEA